MRLVIAPEALKQLASLPKADATRLLTALQTIANAHPQRLSFASELVGQANAWRARKGDYRAIYIQADDLMTVVAVGHRREVYR